MTRCAPGLLIALAASTLALLLLLHPCSYRASPSPAENGPDLVVSSISLDPPYPEANQTCTQTLVIENQGNEGISFTPFYYYLYVDPVDDPPTIDTPHTYYSGRTWMDVGESTALHRTHVFTTTGCDHVVYGWVDRDDDVSEIDETNNVLSLTVCVGVTCAEDIYESGTGDDTCAAATWITSTMGILQSHTLCPVLDEDWLKFVAMEGITYTLSVTDTGTHADPLLYLYSSCGSVSLAEGDSGSPVEWRCPTTGLYYAQVIHREDQYGPLSSYSLAMTTDVGSLYDLYEPDDGCMAARDISTGGVRQTHYFQEEGDEDWVKFPVESGGTYVVTADNVGSGVSPDISLYVDCGQAFADSPGGDAEAEYESTGGGMVYARVVNANSEVHGPDAQYDLSVTTIACVPDDYEEDDAAPSARAIPAMDVATTHNICPAGDEDWIKFEAISGTVYALETSSLGPTADTELFLYGIDGTTELAYNDDYLVQLLDSRIIWQASASGTFYGMVRHVQEDAAGAATQYNLTVSEGVCSLDDFEVAGDNGPLESEPISIDGIHQRRNLCPQGDQDWVRFQVGTGVTLTIGTSDLGHEADTVLELYGPDGTTLVAANDDYAPGGASQITYTVPSPGTYYARVVSFNTNRYGDGTSYHLSVTGELPPTPTPTATPLPTPTPSPTPPPMPPNVNTLILVNRERTVTLYGEVVASQLMAKLYELAGHTGVQGLVMQVELVPSVAAAYGDWKADMLDTDKANHVASAIRNLVLSNADSNPHLEHILIVGGDWIIPFRRTPDLTSKKEDEYADEVTPDTTQWAACRDAMSLTDNYYGDKVPTAWSGGELYLPDFSVGRLIETPEEIMAFIDAFLSEDSVTASNALVTGYDFVQDGASAVKTLLLADQISADADLIGYSWPGSQLAAKQLAATPRFDVQSINGHANHTTEIAPDGNNVTASNVASATIDMAGAIVFTVGCHSGLNDSGVLDLAQAFARKKANYVANTGYGWGGGGVSFSEGLMREYARKLLGGTSAEMGKALAEAKTRYYDKAVVFDGFDEKILIESTLYGLPMYTLNTNAALEEEDSFPSVHITPSLPSGSFEALNVGHMAFGLAGSFGAYDEVTDVEETYFGQGSFFALDGNVNISAGEPIQPRFFADMSAPDAGALRGVVFTGGIYTDVLGFDPVIVQPFNEYVTPTAEAPFAARGWYPPVSFGHRSRATSLGTTDTLVTLMGQFNSETGTERLFESMSLDAYYSGSTDTDPPIVTYLDGFLDVSAGEGHVKVEAEDPSGVERVVIAYTDGHGAWLSQDLSYDSVALKWKGQVAASLSTEYFVQAVDGAGNVQVVHNKGSYYSFSPPAPLVEGGAPAPVLVPLVLNG